LKQAGDVGLAQERRVVEDYRRRLSDVIDIKRMWDPFVKSKNKSHLSQNSNVLQSFFDEFLDCHLADHLLIDGMAYFIVDASASADKATEEFKQNLKMIQREKNDVTIDKTIFGDWRAMRVLPYIDLRMFDTIEQKRRGNVKIRIAPKQLGIALFGCEDSRFVNVPGRASALGNPSSKIYRSLLHAAKAELRQNVQSSRIGSL
jgi:hypothetical protein